MSNIIKRYVEDEYRQKGNIKSFKATIKSQVLREMNLELKFFSGLDVTDIFDEEKKGKKPKAYDLELLEDLGNRVNMTILPTNKETFL